MIVRDYLPDDVDAVIALFRNTVRAVNSRDYTAPQIAAWAPDRIDRGEWADRLARNFTYVAAIEAAIVGFCELEPDGRIHTMYVHRDCQGQGVATALLARIVERAREMGLAALSTEVSIMARPFFERRGFTVVEQQTVTLRGQSFRNYRMTLTLG